MHRYRILVLGSSDVTSRPSQAGGTVPEMLQAALAQRGPDAVWDVEGFLLYPTEAMAERARGQIERVRPHVIHLSLGSNTFVEKTVLFSIRKRMPSLYPLAARVIGAAKAGAGGGAEAGPGLRGSLYRAARGPARLLFGMAPMIDPDAALAATKETMAYLGGLGLPVIVRLPEGNIQQADQREDAARQTAAYNAVVRELCGHYGFPVFRLSDELGPRYGRTPDGLHSDAPTQAYGVSRTADLIAEALGLATQK